MLKNQKLLIERPDLYQQMAQHIATNTINSGKPMIVAVTGDCKFFFFYLFVEKASLHSTTIINKQDQKHMENQRHSLKEVKYLQMHYQMKKVQLKLLVVQ